MLVAKLREGERLNSLAGSGSGASTRTEQRNRGDMLYWVLDVLWMAWQFIGRPVRPRGSGFDCR